MDADGDAAVDALGRADQLQPEVEVPRVLEVVGADPLDPLVDDLVEVDRGVEGEPREDRHLRGGVLAVDVVGRDRPRRSRAAAPRASTSAYGAPVRAISPRMKLVVPLTIPWIRSTCARRERLLQHADDRHDAGDGGLEAQLHLLLAGDRPQLLAVLGEQLLVGGDDVLAGAHRADHVVARRLDPADQLGDQVGAGEDLLEVASGARQHAGDLGPSPVTCAICSARWGSSSAKAAPTVP